MKEFFEGTYGKLLLIAFVTGIWGMNIFTFSGLSGSDESNQAGANNEVTLDDLSIPSHQKYIYNTSARDPFAVPDIFRTERPVQQNERERKEPEYIKPVVRFSGVLDGMAILSAEGGETFFVAEQDTFTGIYVKRISQDSVILVHRENEFTVKLN